MLNEHPCMLNSLDSNLLDCRKPVSIDHRFEPLKVRLLNCEQVLYRCRFHCFGTRFAEAVRIDHRFLGGLVARIALGELCSQCGIRRVDRFQCMSLRRAQTAMITVEPRSSTWALRPHLLLELSGEYWMDVETETEPHRRGQNNVRLHSVPLRD